MYFIERCELQSIFENMLYWDTRMFFNIPDGPISFSFDTQGLSPFWGPNFVIMVSQSWAPKRA